VLAPLSPLRASAQDDDYERLIEEALAEYEGGRYEEARALFARAHHVHPSARTLRGMGMAAYEVRDYVASVRALSASLADPRLPLTPELRTQVEQLLERARRFVGRYRVRLRPEGAALIVDGTERTLDAPDVLLLGAGQHTIEGRCERCATRTISVVVRGGEDEELTLSFLAAPGERPLSPGRRAAGITLGVLAGSFAAASVLIGALWWPARSDDLAECRRMIAACFNVGQLVRQRNAVAGMTIGVGVGAVGLGITAAAVFLARGGEAERASIPRCAPGPRALLCEVTF
jgi:hypothetical protein